MRATHAIPAWLVIWLGVFWVCHAHGQEFALARAPSDLLLTPEEAAQSQALSQFAWGFFLQLQDADPEAYQSHFMKALALQPQSRALLQLTIAPWTAARDYEAILKNLAPLTRQHPEIVHLHLIYTATLLAADRAPAAIDHLRWLFYEEEIRDPKILRELYALNWQTEQLAANEKLLNRARRDPKLRDAFVTHYAFAHRHFTAAKKLAADNSADNDTAIRRHKKRALRHAEKALEQSDGIESVRDVDLLIEIFDDFERYQQAILLLQKARNELPEFGPGLQLQMAVYYEELNHRQKALEMLSGIDINKVMNPGFLVRYGRQMIVVGRNKDAELAFRRAVALAPNDLRIRLPLGYLWLRLNAPEMVVKMLEPISNLPSTALLIMSQAHREMGDLPKATEFLERAEATARTEEDSDFISAQLYLYKASLYEQMQEPEKTIATLREALHVYPTNARANNFLGYFLADQNRDLAEAEQMICLAVAQEPENVAYLDSLAWVYYRQGRNAEALERISQALRYSEDAPDPVILDHAGDIYAVNGYHVLAMEYWWRAIEAGAETSDVIRAKIEAAKQKDALPRDTDSRIN